MGGGKYGFPGGSRGGQLAKLNWSTLQVGALVLEL